MGYRLGRKGIAEGLHLRYKQPQEEINPYSGRSAQSKDEE